MEGSKTLTLGTMQCNIYYTIDFVEACMVFEDKILKDSVQDMATCLCTLALRRQ